jgi:hypothetical protein
MCSGQITQILIPPLSLSPVLSRWSRMSCLQKVSILQLPFIPWHLKIWVLSLPQLEKNIIFISDLCFKKGGSFSFHPQDGDLLRRQLHGFLWGSIDSLNYWHWRDWSLLTWLLFFHSYLFIHALSLLGHILFCKPIELHLEEGSEINSR